MRETSHTYHRYSSLSSLLQCCVPSHVFLYFLTQTFSLRTSNLSPFLVQRKVLTTFYKAGILSTTIRFLIWL